MVEPSVEQLLSLPRSAGYTATAALQRIVTVSNMSTWVMIESLTKRPPKTKMRVPTLQTSWR